MKRRWVLGAVCASVFCVQASFSRAGEITFKNGDHLTGNVTSPEEGKLTIDSPVVGKVTVPLSDVASFTTDAPVAVKLKDGTTAKGPVVAEAVPTTAPAATQASVGNRTIAPGDIVSIAPPTKAQPWHGDVLVGGSLQTGNTQTKQVSAAANAVKRGEDDRITLAAQYLFGRQKDNSTGNETTTTDSAFATAKYDYFITKKLYAYGLMRYDHDAIADLNYRLSPSVGLGYQWHESAKWNFYTEAGIGWTYEDYDTTGTREYVSGRLAYHYDRKLSDHVALTHNVEYLPSLEDFNIFIIHADLGIRADLTKTMFGDFKVQWTYNSDPAPHSLENDVKYIAAVGWRF